MRFVGEVLYLDLWLRNLRQRTVIIRQHWIINSQLIFILMLFIFNPYMPHSLTP